MKIYRLIISADNGIQAITDTPPKELLNRNLYSDYKFDCINSIIWDLDKGAKATDVVNVGTLSLDGFAINKKVFDILNNFNLLKIQFVDIVETDMKDYKFMFFNSDLTSKLDYERSGFRLVEDMLGDITELDIKVPKNREAVLSAYDNYCVEDIFCRLTPGNGYHFLPDLNIYEWDVFRIGHFDMSFYISERVKTMLEQKHITGVEFVEEPLFNIL